MTPEAFIAKWRPSTRTERSASHEHFLDLCELIQVPKPGDVDPHGTEYTLDKLTKRLGRGTGFADAWKKDCFEWEYKGPRKNLVQAYAQLKQYSDTLGNPPLLIVSDTKEIRIHTNWTNTISQEHVIQLADLVSPETRQLLRWCWLEPDRLRPNLTREVVTADAATRFARIAILLRRQFDDGRVAHFLNKLVFCLFAEQTSLLPDRIFTEILDEAVKRPNDLEPMLGDLFHAMKQGGRFGAAAIPWFNGGLFDDDDLLPLGLVEVRDLVAAARLDWSAIDPTIFGTLFERGLDEKKRKEMASLFDLDLEKSALQSNLFRQSTPDKGVGIHYTDPGTIMKLIEPVVMQPLRDEWENIKQEIRDCNERALTTRSPAQRTILMEKAKGQYFGFRDRIG